MTDSKVDKLLLIVGEDGIIDDIVKYLKIAKGTQHGSTKQSQNIKKLIKLLTD